MYKGKWIKRIPNRGKNIEHFYWHPLFCLLFLLQFVIPLIQPQLISASEFSSVKHKSLNDFEVIYSQTSRGLDFQMIGESFLIEKKIKKVSRLPLKVSSPVKKAFLIWSGEVKEHNKNVGKIHFLGPKNKEHRITAQFVWKKNSTGILYSALAEVTRHVTGSGLYGVENLASDVMNPGGRDPYTVAGWALLVVTEDRKSDEIHSVAFMAGLQVLKPGETYDLSLIPYLPKGSMESSSIGIIGGHGRAGNGSGNLLNGTAISGEDDWDGSAGKFWDIDLFRLNPDTNNVALEGKMALTIDPLLQWLYPIGIVLELRSPNKKEK
jgi:hypothetical protein